VDNKTSAVDIIEEVVNESSSMMTLLTLGSDLLDFVIPEDDPDLSPEEVKVP
jgi:hypothetical protein